MIRQFLRFLIVGGVNTLASYAVYLAFLYFLNPYWSYIASYISGIFLSYILHLKFTFRSAHRMVKIASYPLVYVVQFALGISILHLALKAGIAEEIAPLFAVVISIPVTFFMSRRIMSGGK